MSRVHNARHADGYEDERNRQLGMIYCCPEDSRLVVPDRYLIGGTWNVGRPRVFPAILLAVFVAVGPVPIAWHFDLRNGSFWLAFFIASLLLAIFTAIRLSRTESGLT